MSTFVSILSIESYYNLKMQSIFNNKPKPYFKLSTLLKPFCLICFHCFKTNFFQEKTPIFFVSKPFSNS